MARVKPFPFTALAEVKPHRFVTVNTTTGGVTYPATLAATNGISVGETTADIQEPISIVSVADVTETLLVECSATIAKGAKVGGAPDGRAKVDATNGTSIALESGVVGQIINVISAKAFV